MGDRLVDDVAGRDVRAGHDQGNAGRRFVELELAEQAVSAERTVSREMGGSCSMPLAAHAVWRGVELHLAAAWGVVDDAPAAVARSPLVRTSAAATVDSLLQAEVLGQGVAQQLCRGGAVRSPG